MVYCSGTDLRDLWTGRLTWRRLGVLVKYLPPESATKTALRNDAPPEELKRASSSPDAKYGPWSQTEMLLAELIDLGRWLQWSKTKDAADNKNVPEPFPRPGVVRKQAELQASPADAAKVISLLEYMRHNQGAAPDGFVQE